MSEITKSSDNYQLLRQRLTRRVLEAIEQDATNYLDVDKMGREIIKELDARKHATIWKLLGLDNRWGQWDIDHCNGRNSPITQYLSTELELVVGERVREAVAEVVKSDGPQMIKKIRAGIQRELKDRYTRAIRDQVIEQTNRIVEAEAKEIARSMVEDVLRDCTN